MEDKCWFESVCTLVKPECNKSCVRYTEFGYLLEHSNLPRAKWKPIALYPNKVDYESFMRLAEFKDNIVKNVESGANLYIGSEHTGNGKTSWAIKILLKYFSEVWAEGLRPRGLFIHVPTFLNQLKDFGANNPNLAELKRLIPEVDLVVWDDVSTYSGYDLSQLTSYIDGRLLSEKANIFTGNLLQEDFEKNLGGKLTSRVWTSSEQVILYGEDNRGVSYGSISDNQ